LYRSTAAGKRLIRLTEAFRNDGFEVTRVITYNGRTGIAAENKTALNYDTGKPKKAYYIEGNPYELGYLMGNMAEKEVSLMMEYADRVVFSFIGIKVLEKIKLIQSVFIRLVYELSKKSYNKLPLEIQEEIRGIYEGCKAANPKTKVNINRLVALNLGIDSICSMVYTGNFLKRDELGLEPEDFTIPLMCNAFTVCGKSAGNGYYFGRDFTFPTAGVFQDSCALIIYNPMSWTGSNRRSIPFVNISAPGMVGSIAAMNLEGVAIGVNMSPGANCDPGNLGVNSLLMARLCVQYGDSAQSASDLMVSLPRGVSWLYIIADGKTGRSCAAEAGASMNEPDFTQYPAKEYRPLLPDMEYIREHSCVPFQDGIMFRWNDYHYPTGYLAYNHRLWSYFNQKNNKDKTIRTGAFDKKGYINKPGEQNCPSTFYFAPQREDNDEVLVVTNHYIIPEMRYFAMHSWTQRVIGKRVNDIQWRYDELNRSIYDRLAERGSISFEDARELISFLSPTGKNKDYHDDNPKSKDGKQLRIEGCISLFDLKNMVVESHYGYFCDKWVRLSLKEYFE
jgi:hypothetical protein